MLPKFIEKMYKGTLFSRHDDDGTLYYLSIDNFPGLLRKEYSIKNQNGHLLGGYFYYYEGYRTDSLVIFEHGMGVGHRAYMREIETLCKRGYLVYSYDHTGCTESEGEHIRGFSGSLADLDEVVSDLLSLEEIKNKKVSVVGHSWGGFSTMNIGALHKELHSLVAISGFSSVKAIQKQIVPLFLRPFVNGLFEIEKKENPSYAEITSYNSLKNTDAKVLIIHSDDDKTVNCKIHFDYLKSLLDDKDNIEFLKVAHKDHNPNYTEDAVLYKNKYINELKLLKKKGKLKSKEDFNGFNAKYDFYRMTEQDSALWKKIFETIG